MKTFLWIPTIAAAALLALAHSAGGKEEKKEITVRGEVLDLVCYIDHGATGADHAECAEECIAKGLPLGLKGEDGKTYLLVGEHKLLNKEFAKLAAKTVTVRGKLSSRDGFHMLENAELVK